MDLFPTPGLTMFQNPYLQSHHTARGHHWPSLWVCSAILAEFLGQLASVGNKHSLAQTTEPFHTEAIGSLSSDIAPPPISTQIPVKSHGKLRHKQKGHLREHSSSTSEPINLLDAALEHVERHTQSSCHQLAVWVPVQPRIPENTRVSTSLLRESIILKGSCLCLAPNHNSWNSMNPSAGHFLVAVELLNGLY